MCNRYLLFAAIILLFVSALFAAVPTTLDDFTLPGSQPLQSSDIRTSAGCDCHANYNRAVEPMANWKGSMMSQAARDMLFWASVAIANQDAPNSGDLCLRCHTPRGWLSGRSTPTDGSALTQDDRDGVNCHFCHKSVKPSPLGVNPYPAEAYYTTNTYPADQTYLGILATIPSHSANGAYVVSDQDVRRGPYIDEAAPHQVHYSPFHNDASMCGTCHDVSNPAFSKTAGGDYEPNTFGAPAPNFSPYAMFPVERTFSEWKMSAYNTTAGVYAPQFGGNKDTVRTCQDCHMRDVTGKGCNKNNAPVRSDLGLHDMTGGNTFLPLTIAAAFPADGVDQVALDSGIVRARRMLQLATSMTVSAAPQSGSYLATVRVTNETGHKLPSGYPEGRRIWLNVKAYSQTNTLLYQSGAYDNTTAVLTHDADIKVYEIKPGISQSLAPVVSLPAGPSFHFVLNDTIYEDNRIPPRGFTNANFASIQSPVVGHTYIDGQYWDETTYQIPGATARLEVTLYYQTTTKEMVEFLRDENHTNTDGTKLYNLWTTYGKSAPVVMNTDTLLLTPLGGNNAPILATIGPKQVDENSTLNFGVSATDPDGTTPTLTTSALPSGATFTPHGNGTGTFTWTPTFSQAGAYPVTFRASDGTLLDSEVVTITVLNVNRPPVLAAIGPRAVNEGILLSFRISASDADGTTPSLTTSSLPTGATFVDSGNGAGAFNWTPTFAQAGPYSVTFRASDGTAADSEVVAITVNNVNQSPVLAEIGSKSVQEEHLLTIGVSATDADGAVPVLSTSTLPSGATFADSGNGHGRFDWTPTLTQAGSYPLTFYASDGSATDSERVIITVLDAANRPPVLAAIGNRSINEASLLTFGVTATDADLNVLTITAAPLPGGAAFTDHANSSATFSWTPTYDQAGVHNLRIIVSDGVAADSELITITVNNVNRAPSMDPVENQTVASGTPLQIDIFGWDMDSDSVTFRAANLPEGAVLTDLGWDGPNDAYHGRINWTPTAGQIGLHPGIRIVVTDLTDSVWTTISIEVTSGGCCVNATGNVDCDPADGVDIADLTALIDHLFVSFPALCCQAEANCDGVGGIDIGDLTALIDNLFISFTPPAACP